MAGPLDLLTGPLRSLLGDAQRAERSAVAHSPVAQTRELEERLAEAVAAAHRAASSVERHVEAIDALAASLPPLTTSVTRLTDQISELLRITSPLAAAERDISRLGHLFGRRREAGTAPAAPPGSEDS